MFESKVISCDEDEMQATLQPLGLDQGNIPITATSQPSLNGGPFMGLINTRKHLCGVEELGSQDARQRESTAVNFDTQTTRQGFIIP